MCFLALMPEVKAEAMPEGQKMLACYCPAFTQSDFNFYNFAKNFMADYESYMPAYREKIKQEFPAIANIKEFTQEQAEKEIGQLIDSKKLPNYILDKGKYKYDSSINSVYFIEELNLRSQPNPEARVLTEIFGVNPEYERNNFASEAYDYLGEWTNPQGTEWIITKTILNDEELIGFAPKSAARFVTNEQIRNFAYPMEVLIVAAEVSIADKEELRAQLNQQLQEVQQRAQAQVQQARQQAQQSQQQSSVMWFYCSKCGTKTWVNDPIFLPSGNNACKYGAHNWNRLQ